MQKRPIILRSLLMVANPYAVLRERTDFGRVCECVARIASQPLVGKESFLSHLADFPARSFPFSLLSLYDIKRAGETARFGKQWRNRERERERERETERERDRETERQRQRDRERQRETDRDRQREREREREREMERERERT